MPMREMVGVAVALAAICTVGARAQEAGEGYKLGPEDRVRVIVHEWRTARNEAYEWAALKGEFTVNAAGALSLPLIGEVGAAGLRSDELASTIAARLQSRVGLAQRPDAAVEVVQFRPFYVIGAIAKPGDYPYRPNMTVLQAISIAGGFYRPLDPGLLRFQRETITSTGELRLLVAERDALHARRARLQAEIGNAAALSAPENLAARQGNPAVAQLLREEQAILDFRRNALRSQVESLEQLKALLQSEVEALRAKDATQERQFSLAKRELENVNSLATRGLIVSARQLSAEQAVAQLESARQDLALSILRARQDISKADRDILDLRNKRQTEVALELRQVQAKLQELSEKAATTERLIDDTETTTPKLIEDRMQDDVAPPIYSIVRRKGEVSGETIVAESAAIEPGDILKVERRASARPSSAEANAKLAPSFTLPAAAPLRAWAPPSEPSRTR